MALRDQLLKPGMYAELSAAVGADQNSSRGWPTSAWASPMPTRPLSCGNSCTAITPAATRESYLHHVTRHIAAGQTRRSLRDRDRLG